MEINKRELYNILVEEKFNGGSAVTKDPNYLKLDTGDDLKWPLLHSKELKFNPRIGISDTSETIKVRVDFFYTPLFFTSLFLLFPFFFRNFGNER